MTTLSLARRSLLALVLAAATAASAAPTLWVDDASGILGKVDVGTGAVTLVGSMGEVMTDIAFDPSGNLFGVTFASLYRIDPATAASTWVGNLGTPLNSLVFSSDGTLYGAGAQLYQISTATGAASLIGSGGTSYLSSGDLAFVDGELYLSSTTPASDSLIRIDRTTGFGTLVGAIGVSGVFGLASDNNLDLYGVADTGVYRIDTMTGAGTLLTNYSGRGLGAANGTAFVSEAMAPIPEPETYALLLAGLGAMGFVARRRKPESA